MPGDLKVGPSLAEQLRTWWFASVTEISDIALQRRTWLDMTNSNPHWSFIEFVCSYPDLDQLSQARQEGWLSTAEFKILEDLRGTIDAYSPPKGDNYDNAAVLNDPSWHAVVAAAEHAKQQLLSLTGDRREREALLGVD